MTNFPTSLDTTTQLPTAATLASGNLDTIPHSAVHGNEDSALIALETKVGIDGSADTNSLDFKVANKQPLDSDLTTIAGLTATTDNFMVAVSSAWASRTPTQVKTTLGLTIGTNVQAWDADLDTIAGLTATTNNFMVASGSAWASRTPTQALAHLGLDADLATFALPASTTISAYAATLVDDVDAATARTTLGLGTAATHASTDYLLVANNLSDVTAATARTNLGLGTIATQASNSVTITGGSITGITDLTVADGGTGQSTLTNHGVLLGQGASALAATSAGTNTQLLQSGGASSDPAWATLSGDATIANGGAVTLKNTGPGATGPIGDSSHVAAVTIDAQGRVTALSSVAVTGGSADKLGLTPTAVKTATTYTAAAGDFVPCDTTSNSITVTLPTAPGDGSVVSIKHVIQGSTNTVTISCGGSDVFNKAGGATSASLPNLAEGYIAQYKSSGAIWYLVAHDGPRTSQYFDSIGPTTTRGDLIVRGASANTSLAIGSAGKYLKSDGTDPSWQTIPTVATDVIWDTKGDLAVATGADTAAKLAVSATQGAGPLVDSSATPGLVYGFGQSGTNVYLAPTGAIAETMNRSMPVSSSATLASGTLRLQAIFLQKNVTVTSISFRSVGAASTPTHWWFALLDSSRVYLRSTGDQTTTAWGATTTKTVNLSSTFITTYEGLHYIGIMMSGTTGVGIPVTTSASDITGVTPILGGTSTTGMTTPQSDGATAGAIASTAGQIHGWVS